MSFFDNMKNKAEDLAKQHEEKISDGIDKVSQLIDNKTGGQHSDKIDAGAEKAKGLLEDLAGGNDVENVVENDKLNPDEVTKTQADGKSPA